MLYACYICGVVRRGGRLQKLPDKAYRLCTECARVVTEREQAFMQGMATGIAQGINEGRERGVQEEKARRWVDGKGSPNT